MTADYVCKCGYCCEVQLPADAPPTCPLCGEEMQRVYDLAASIWRCEK